jgi:hypothetical protein
VLLNACLCRCGVHVLTAAQAQQHSVLHCWRRCRSLPG